MNNIIENISKITVSSIMHIYDLFVINAYFIISNLLGLITLVVLSLSFNNLVFFILPILLFIQSILMQFTILEDNNSYSIKKYITKYIQIMKNNWKSLVGITIVLLLIICDLKILMFIEAPSFLIIATIITAMFVLNSILYFLLIRTRKESHELPLIKIVTSSVLLSYKLPFITVLNFICMFLAIYSIQFLPMVYILFIGGGINILIWKNLTKKFSLNLFFEEYQILKG